MKGNRELDELLMSYIAGELDAERKALAEQFINTDQETRKHFEALLSSWQLMEVNQQLNKIDISREWNRFEQFIVRKEQKLTVVRNDVPANESSTEEMPVNNRTRIILIAVSIAASVLALVVLGWMFTGSEKNLDKVVAAVEKTVDSGKVFLRHEINTTRQARKLVLQDGSVIMLSGKSEVSYREPFIASRRDIILKGEAAFAVAKDAARPFTVYSMDLATTALGTHFTITAFEEAATTIVKLTEGKVVIQPVRNQKGSAKAYYLFPGQQLVYNNGKQTATVLNLLKKKQQLQQAVTAQAYDDAPIFPGNKKGSWYMFNNQSLEQVFDQLSLLYHTDIRYSKKDLVNLYFLGSFNKSDSLDMVLKQIAALNNLTVTKQHDTFVIAR